MLSRDLVVSPVRPELGCTARALCAALACVVACLYFSAAGCVVHAGELRDAPNSYALLRHARVRIVTFGQELLAAQKTCGLDVSAEDRRWLQSSLAWIEGLQPGWLEMERRVIWRSVERAEVRRYVISIDRQVHLLEASEEWSHYMSALRRLLASSGGEAVAREPSGCPAVGE